METQLAELQGSERTRALLREGRYFVASEFALRRELYPKVIAAFLAAVEELEGRACREKVAADGLGKIHLHFPVEKVVLLQDRVLKKLRTELYYWSYRVGVEDLDLRDEFFVDHLILVRVHYPFLVARTARAIAQPPIAWGEKARAAWADLRSWHMLVGRLADFGHWAAGRLGRDAEALRYDVVAHHHRGLPAPARSHGPHIDTWYGHSYDGINLWWSIEGVNPDNTVILYPETFGHPLAYDPRTMYLAPGIPLPRPVKVDLARGDLLLFNPEMLHSTQVNISDETRIALTTRINPRTPRFNPNAAFHFQHWRSSRDLARRRFARIHTFPKRKFRGEPTPPERLAPLVQRTIRVRRSERLGVVPVAVCASRELRGGDKVAVDLANAKLLLYRGPRGLSAFQRNCPHLGVDLNDGHHDGVEVFCPGHGIAYSLEDGASPCSAFALRRYQIFERDGSVFVAARPASP